MRIIILVFVVLTSYPVYAQINETYVKKTNAADSFFLHANYEQSVNLYTTAFAANNDMAKVKHRYRLAAAYAQTNKIEESFTQLFRIAEKGKFTDYELLSRDILFENLRADARWIRVLKLIRNNYELEEKSKE